MWVQHEGNGLTWPSFYESVVDCYISFLALPYACHLSSNVRNLEMLRIPWQHLSILSSFCTHIYGRWRDEQRCSFFSEYNLNYKKQLEKSGWLHESIEPFPGAFTVAPYCVSISPGTRQQVRSMTDDVVVRVTVVTFFESKQHGESRRGVGGWGSGITASFPALLFSSRKPNTCPPEINHRLPLLMTFLRLGSYSLCMYFGSTFCHVHGKSSYTPPPHPPHPQRADAHTKKSLLSKKYVNCLFFYVFHELELWLVSNILRRLSIPFTLKTNVHMTGRREECCSELSQILNDKTQNRQVLHTQNWENCEKSNCFVVTPVPLNCQSNTSTTPWKNALSSIFLAPIYIS